MIGVSAHDNNWRHRVDGKGVVGRRLSGSAIARRSSCWRAQVPTYVQASPTRPEQPSLHSGSLASTVGGGILAAGTAFAVPRASSGERPTLVRGPSRPSDIFAPYPPFYLMDMSHILTSHNEPLVKSCSAVGVQHVAAWRGADGGERVLLAYSSGCMLVTGCRAPNDACCIWHCRAFTNVASHQELHRPAHSLCL